MEAHLLKRVLVLGVLGLSACGQPLQEPADAPTAEIEIELPSTDGSDSASPAGMLPPGPTFAEDGETISVAIGDEISIKLELPDKVGTSNAWQLKDNSWPDHLSWGNTWMSIEGSKRYSDIIVNADAVGESDLTFVRYADGQQTDDEKTITVIVN